MRNAQITRHLQEMLGGTPPAGYVANCEAIRDDDLRGQVGSISVPTLVIAGTHDNATPAKDGRAVAEAIVGARYVEFDAAHLSNWEQPDAFTQAVVDFLAA